MGNREALVEGAKLCLLEKGYSRTTARDISASAGVSLAAIGYHFGSKEALLNEALVQAITEWGDDLASALTSSGAASATPAERFEATWANVIASFEQSRALWGIQFELLGHLDRNPELRAMLSEANRQAQLGLVELFGVPVDPASVAKVGAYLQVLLAGAAAQWLADPGAAPSGRDLLDAMRAFTAALASSG